MGGEAAGLREAEPPGGREPRSTGAYPAFPWQLVPGASQLGRCVAGQPTDPGGGQAQAGSQLEPAGGHSPSRTEGPGLPDPQGRRELKGSS